MIDGLLGFLVASGIFTFFPSLGGKISNGLKAGVAWVRSKVRA
jgi:hypothetical protein